MNNKIYTPNTHLVDAQGNPITPVQEKKEARLRIIPMPPFKLKAPNRTAMVFDLEKLFGFIPKKVVVKMPDDRQNNAFQLCAIDDRPVEEVAPKPEEKGAEK